MIVDINNSEIKVTDPTDSLLSKVVSELTYTDKSKQYQIKRMSKNLWQRNSPLYKQLQQEVSGTLYTYENNTLSFSSCFFEHLKDELIIGQLNDSRKITGAKIALPWVKKPHNTRDYQQEAVDLMLVSYRGLINFATSLGKTNVAVHAIKALKTRTLVICPSESIAKQFHKLLCDSFGSNRVGMYGDGQKKIKDITVGIAASVSRNTEDFKKAQLGLIIFDETHRIACDTFFTIASELSDVGRIFGMTATDYRSDGKDIFITAGCGSTIIRRDIIWGIANKWLAEPYFIVKEVETKGRDFKDNKLKSYKEHVLNNQTMKDTILNDAQKMIAAGKSVLVLVAEVAHGKELSQQLGVPFATGEDSDSQKYLDQLNAAKIPGLVATAGKMGEGSDTRNVDVLILASFIAAKGPTIQAVGRALRKQGTKTKALILDYIPTDSTMLARHARQRVSFYREITDKVKVIK